MKPMRSRTWVRASPRPKCVITQNGKPVVWEIERIRSVCMYFSTTDSNTARILLSCFSTALVLLAQKFEAFSRTGILLHELACRGVVCPATAWLLNPSISCRWHGPFCHTVLVHAS